MGGWAWVLAADAQIPTTKATFTYLSRWVIVRTEIRLRCLYTHFAIPITSTAGPWKGAGCAPDSHAPDPMTLASLSPVHGCRAGP